jgi:hypothetical protein
MTEAIKENDTGHVRALSKRTAMKGKKGQCKIWINA